MSEIEEEQDLVLYERLGTTAKVTMNRPRYRNAQNVKMTHAIDAAFTRAVEDVEVKVIVLAGAGPHFSAGHDIGTPARDIHCPFPGVATVSWDHSDKEGRGEPVPPRSRSSISACAGAGARSRSPRSPWCRARASPAG